MRTVRRRTTPEDIPVDAQALYPTVRLTAGCAECYNKSTGGELCSCPIAAEGGEEKMAIVFFGGQDGNRWAKEAVQATAREIAHRYNLHETLATFVEDFCTAMEQETESAGLDALDALYDRCKALLAPPPQDTPDSDSDRVGGTSDQSPSGKQASKSSSG